MTAPAGGLQPGESRLTFTIVSANLPDPSGRAAGRLLAALGGGLVEAGHDVRVWSWADEEPMAGLPAWCSWHRGGVRMSRLHLHLRSLLAPRSEVDFVPWQVPLEGIVVADEPMSFPAVRDAPDPYLIVAMLTALDRRALGRWSPAHVQDWRGERRAVKAAGSVLAYSSRVALAVHRPATFVPAGYPIPAEPLPLVEEPVTALLANWRWAPNVWALDLLLRSWPGIRAAVPGSRLLLAGEGLGGVGTIPGVEVLGHVADSLEVLGRAAVLPFPCPSSSGPKVKVMEALALGVPVVTTAYGIEGLCLPPGAGALVTSVDGFAAGLVELLAHAERRAELASSGRAAMDRWHSPLAAARALVAACGVGSGDQPCPADPSDAAEAAEAGDGAAPSPAAVE